MADEQKTESSTTTTQQTETQVAGNDPAARNPDGSLKASAPILSPKEEPKKSDTEVKKEEPKVDGKKEEPKKADAKAAPEKYEFKAPEGFALNDELIAKATPIFKELGLTQDAAQKLVDLYSGEASKTANEPFETYQTMRSDWRKDVIASDLGNGKDGLKPEVEAVMARAIDSLPKPVADKFRDALTMTGAGDNPDFIRAFHAIASQRGEGTLVAGRGPSPGGQTNSGRPPSPAQALYPNLPSSAR